MRPRKFPIKEHEQCCDCGVDLTPLKRYRVRPTRCSQCAKERIREGRHATFKINTSDFKPSTYCPEEQLFIDDPKARYDIYG